MARRKHTAPIEAPWWVRVDRVPEGWPGGFRGWQAAIDGWFDDHPEAEEEWVALLSRPIFSPAEWEAP